MTCKKVYIGQELTEQNVVYGAGSIYLCGPRNPKGKSWRLDLMKKIENTKTSVSFLIPESMNGLRMDRTNEFPSDDRLQWQLLAISVATCILFWYPDGVTDVQSDVQVGALYKSDRTFIGMEGDCDHDKYIKWLYFKQHKMYPCSTKDELVDIAINWMRK